MKVTRIASNFAWTVLPLCWLLACAVQAAAPQTPAMAGNWIINEELSDNTDKKVEAALKAAGEKVKHKLFDRRKDRYRGGPPEQEMYDRISYDPVLKVELGDVVYHFTYADDFSREIYTDNRSHSVSLNQLENAEDFSLGHWENGKLLVEAHPRDGGYAEETYTLIENGQRLQVEMSIKPRAFSVPIELTRVYDRQPAP